MGNNIFSAFVKWGRHKGLNTNGWLFQLPGYRPEPCPEDAWKLGPHPEYVPKVAEVLGREGGLILVMVEHPGNPNWVFVWTRSGGGHWQLRSDGAQVFAVDTLLEPFAG